ncbi:MAG: histidine--tRNA ligase [Erysipelothrix sp.]|nr:histidine--tRNA ligase [Erysipelothrix sp.]
MSKYQKVKGVKDLFDDQMFEFKVVEGVAAKLAELYNISEIRIPEFEFTEVFARENDSSDVVNKEMYTFLDNGNRSLTLRPEWTAGIIRSVVENKLYAKPDLPLKYYYLGTNFRSENPQKGRYRIFNQFGVESIGLKSPYVDAEVIVFANTFMQMFGLKDYKIELNSIGDKASRAAYNKALVEHFSPHVHELCSDCQRRITQNPLRILDCKVDQKHESLINAPFNYEYLNEESLEYYASLKTILEAMNIPFVENPRMVRGLDYYSHTVFEFISTHPDMGSQSTILGGGHYDYLVEQFGGPEMGAVGFGMGIERFLLALKAEGIELNQTEHLQMYILVLDEEARVYAMKVASLLREAGIRVDMNMEKRSMKSQFKTVERQQAQLVALIGSSEQNDEVVTIKNTVNQEQKQVAIMDAVNTALAMLKDNEEEK